MGKSFGRVASFEELKMEKVSIPLLLTSCYIEMIRLLGDFGVGLTERLTRQIEMNLRIESFLSPGIPDDSEYWDQRDKLLPYLTYENARIPQHSTIILRKLNLWDRLLLKEQKKQGLLKTRVVAGRI